MTFGKKMINSLLDRLWSGCHGSGREAGGISVKAPEMAMCKLRILTFFQKVPEQLMYDGHLLSLPGSTFR